MYETVVVPLDGSPFAEQALPYAAALARAGDARVVLVRVAGAAAVAGAAVDSLADAMRQVARAAVPPLAAGSAPATADEPQRILAYLERIATGLREQGCSAEPVAAYGDPARAIVAEVRAHHGDLVVMATHGRSGLVEAAVGSVAQAVVRACPVPVLLVRGAMTRPGPEWLGETPRLVVPLDGSGLAESALEVAAGLAYQLRGELVLLQAVPAGDEAAAEAGERYLSEVADWLVAKHLLERPQVEVHGGRADEAIAGAAEGAAAIVMATHGRSGIGRLVYGSVAAAVLRRGETPVVMVRPAALRSSETPSVPADRDGVRHDLQARRG